MAAFTLTELGPELVRRLQARAAEEGISAQELHRRIVAEALPAAAADERPRTTKDLIDALREMGRLGFRIDMEDRGEGPDRPPLEF